MEPEAAISVYMLFIEEVFCKNKLFFLGKEKKIPLVEAYEIRKP